MPSKIVASRLSSIVATLMAAHRGSADISPVTKGRERELFINMTLGNIISQPFRIGSGEIVDHADNTSGHVDVVIEYANTLSFASVYPHSERLYLAESICACIEIKSNLPDQWPEAVKKGIKISSLQRSVGAVVYVGKPPPKQIPVFAIGYEGWKDYSTVKSKLMECNADRTIISGILQLNPCLYVSESSEDALSFDDELGLFGFLLSIEALTSGMLGAKPKFLRYVK